jgi:tetratricopeptide (TPR) repeat protein
MRVEPIAYSTLSMLERGLTMPSAQSLLTLSTLYQVPAQQLLDLIALERYDERKPATDALAQLEHELASDLRTGAYADAYAKSLRCLELCSNGAGSPDPARRRNQVAATKVYSGIALWKLGWLAQSSATFRDVVDDLGVSDELRGWAYQNLVEVERSLGRLASSHAYARDGLDLAQRVRSDRLQGTFHGTLANLKRDLAEVATDTAVSSALLAEALAHHARAQHLAHQAGDDFLLASDVLNEGVTLAVLGDAARAFERFDRAQRLAEQGSFGRLHAVVHLERGRLERRTGALERARELLWKAETLATEVEASDVQFRACFQLLKVSEALGEDGKPAYRRCLSLKSFQQGRFPELAEFEELQAQREAAS